MGMDEMMKEVLRKYVVGIPPYNDKIVNGCLTALKSCFGEQIKNMPRTPYMSKCCQKAREETIDDVLRVVG